ncbi:PapB/FocB family fimbrial expression transcriptional regulator [Edwardsiella tarda]|uniref:PapB/FocB family fimbrial expression transcriptional regulator n=1 Tax=Edwardsiella tarda TaxID=636 RepID=UPI003D2F2BB0
MISAKENDDKPSLLMTSSNYYLQLTLRAGYVDFGHCRLLIKLLRIKNENMIRALEDYFVNGGARKDICARHCVSQGYLSIKIKQLQQINRIIFLLLPYYLKY